MKKVFTVVLGALALCGAVANAATPGGLYENKTQYCSAKGYVFSNAAESRGLGMSPQSAFDSSLGLESSGKYQISRDYIKRAVNLVYFDPGFTNAGGFPLQQQIMDDCMRDGKAKFQPLQ